ncbi:MAG: preprotein translocase subunit YajC [Oscillospiraceae bacterium]|nr:preprotein translocase subunit YajC [Oscillospiraceae bacterium]
MSFSILTAASGNTTASLLTTLLPFVVLIVVFYFLLIRPENKKKKALSEMRDSLSVGDEVTTIGGIVGKVVHIKDDLVTIETSEDRVRIQFTRWAISTKGTQTTESK